MRFTRWLGVAVVASIGVAWGQARLPAGYWWATRSR